jgi:hypothetical protein
MRAHLHRLVLVLLLLLGSYAQLTTAAGGTGAAAAAVAAAARLQLLVSSAAAPPAPAGWLGPFNNVYSDRDCLNIGNYDNMTVGACTIRCAAVIHCDAINYELASGGCTLRGCAGGHHLSHPSAPWPSTVSYRMAHIPPRPWSNWSIGASGNSRIRGLLNLTAPPFNIDNTGKTDVTAQLQAAITLAHNSFLAVYFSLGDYLVSDTLTAFDPEPHGYASMENNTWPCRFSPNVMIGQRPIAIGATGRPIRPRIILQNSAAAFSHVQQRRPVVDFTMTTDPSHPAQVSGINFNQLFKGIDVVIGDYNPGAIGVQLPGAQGSSIQDTTITVGSGYAGISGGAGAGGSHEMVTVIGGQVGLDYTVTLNCPTITGATLINQSRAAIVYNGLEAASAVGLDIRIPSGSSAVALEVSAGRASKWGEFSMIDSILDFGASPSSSESDAARVTADGGEVTAETPVPRQKCVAFKTNRSLYLRNVYINRCAIIDDGSTVAATANDTWTLVNELALGKDIPAEAKPGDCTPLSMSIFVGGKIMTGMARKQLRNVTTTATSPLSSVTSQHNWGEATFPSLDEDSSKVVNVRDMGAKGDGITDDTIAIQKALHAPGATVLLPKGFYRLSKTLVMEQGGALALVGVSRTTSVLMPISDGIGSSEAPLPVLSVTNPEDRIVLTMFTIVTWEHLDNTWALDWRNHNHRSTYRQNYFYRITECLYGFPHPTPMPVRKPTMPCRPQASLAHPLNRIAGSIRAYNFGTRPFLWRRDSHIHVDENKGMKLNDVVCHRERRLPVRGTPISPHAGRCKPPKRRGVVLSSQL